MRSFGTILAVFALLMGMACAAVCAVPVAGPPCHQQKDAPKACDQQTLADAAAKWVLPAAGVEPLFAAPILAPVMADAAARLSPRPVSPPLILRI